MSEVKHELESKLKDTIREAWGEAITESMWKYGKLSRYTKNEAAAKTLVMNAVVEVAKSFNYNLTVAHKTRLKSQITLDLTPAKLLPKLFTALHHGKKCPPGETPTLEEIQNPDGTVSTEWVCRKL